MKKVISLFLTVVMALSMFSCLSVMAGAATTDLVVDQEYIVPSGTTKIFVPEESGHYKFTSKGYGDPRITINCLGGEYEFDDNNGLNFSGTVELEAGEEVRCYLYNYDGEDCKFTITKVDLPESVSVNFTEPLEIVENISGYWNTAEIWNDATEEYVYVDFFVYNVPFQYFSGNTITLTYADGTSDVYTCDGVEYFNEQGEVLRFDYYSDQSYENRWTIGSDNYFTLNVMGTETQIPVTIVEDPYESIEFVLAQPIEIIENTNGYWYSDEIWNEETEEYESVEYYNYYMPSIYNNGNQIVVNYKDGTIDTYVCNGDRFLNGSGELISPECFGYQSYDNQWTLGVNNYIVVSALGKEVQVPVSIIEDPYESIEFVPVKTIEIIENTNGNWSSVDVWNEELEEYETIEFYYYNTPSIYSAGNQIIINYKDGTSKTYTYDNLEYWDFVDSDGNSISVSTYDNQNYENPWVLGSDNYFTIDVLGKEIHASVTIIEDPYESIEFVPAQPIEIIENTNGYWSSDEIWNEETEEYENVEYFKYYTPNDSIYAEGSAITINYKNGAREVYTCDGDNGSYINSSGEYLNFEITSNQSYNNRWILGSDNYLTIELLN